MKNAFQSWNSSFWMLQRSFLPPLSSCPHSYPLLPKFISFFFSTPSFWSFCSSASHQYLHFYEIGRQPRDQVQSLVQHRPSLLDLLSPYFLPFAILPPCLSAIRATHRLCPSNYKTPSWALFRANSWADLPPQAPRERIEPISHSSRRCLSQWSIPLNCTCLKVVQYF